MKTALVLGAGGFIGSHMVKRIKSEGYWVRGVDLKYPEFSKTQADHFVIGDLRDKKVVDEVMSYAGVRKSNNHIFPMIFDKPFDEVYQFAADMGGAGYVFTGDHDADIMHNSAQINLNVCDVATKRNRTPGVIFYSSSACMYPAYNQMSANSPNCSEDSAYPANPDSEYGWEKLFSERLYLSYSKNYGLNVRIARYHNIFGPEGTWEGGKEKAPAAMCRKIAQADDEIEIWGDGEQTRSFLYIDECLEATRRLVQSDCKTPINIGSDEMVTINQLAIYVMKVAQKIVSLKHVSGPLGVRGRTSDNRMIEQMLGWKPQATLVEGLVPTYRWIAEQVHAKQSTSLTSCRPMI